MVLERHLVSKLQSRLHSALDPHLALETYLIACQVEDKSPRTVGKYADILKAFYEFIHPAAEADVTPDIIRRYLLSLKQRNLSPGTLRAHYQALLTYFKWLVNEGLIKEAPFCNIKPPKLSQLLPKPFSSEDIAGLLRETSRHRFTDIRNRAMVLVLLDTGLRLNELSCIQLRDIDLDRESIMVLGKGSKERYVRIGKGTQKALLRYLITRTDQHGCLWVSEERRPMTIAGVQTTLKKLSHRAGIKDAKPGPHTYRHTAAILCLRNGMGEFNLQMMLGHSTLAMTRRYVSTLNSDDVFKAHKIASPVDNLKL